MPPGALGHGYDPELWRVNVLPALHTPGPDEDSREVVHKASLNVVFICYGVLVVILAVIVSDFFLFVWAGYRHVVQSLFL